MGKLGRSILEPFSGSDRSYCKFCSSWKDVKLNEFFHDVRYIFIFYVLGDLLTTIFALETGTGYEANFVIAALLEDYGYYSIVVLKLLFISCCFLDYLYLKNRGYCSLWNLTRHMIAILGILVVINNLLVISGLWSPLYTLIYGF